MTCASNLRQIGIGTLAYSLSNDETYCSGPFDNRELNSYGPIDEAGWLADMVNGEYLVPGNFLCPSNLAQYTHYMTMDRLHDNRPQKTFTEEERSKLIKAGYNTNYTMSWYFGFTEMREPRNAYVGSPKKIDSVIGPLSDRFLARVSPVRVPLMADGRTDGALENYQDFGAGPVRYPSGLWGRHNYADFGPAHIRAPKTNSDDHDRSKGNILFADGHVQNFKDDDRNGGFGWDLSPGGALPSNDKYPEIDEHVFGGNLENDGSSTYLIIRRRPGHSLSLAGTSNYAPEFGWKKDVTPDVDFNSRLDFGDEHTRSVPLYFGNGLDGAQTTALTLEPVQIVDELSWSNSTSKEFNLRDRDLLSNKITETPGFNPDAVSRVRYDSTNPLVGWTVKGGSGGLDRTSPADFSAWVAAFNVNNAQLCDQNNDDLCTPADFSSWVSNFNQGQTGSICP